MYYLNEFFDGQENRQTIIKLLEQGIVNIPIDESNPQYKEYITWVEEGNVVGSWADYTAPLPPVELPTLPILPREPIPTEPLVSE